MEARPDQVPHDVLGELRTTYLKHAARGMMLYGEFTKIFEILHKDGIPFIVLKGADLGETVYGDVALRPISDLDLLIKPRDIPRMTEVFGKIGYHRSQASHWVWHHLSPFVKKGAVPVEVHRDINGPRKSSAEQMEGLWRRAQSRRIGGVNVLALSTEDLLLHLSLHAAHHLFLHSLILINLCDIREILRRRTGEIAWDLLLEIAYQWKATKALFLTLRLAQDILTAEVPQKVLNALRPPDFHDQYLWFAKEEIFADTKVIPKGLGQMYTAPKIMEKLKVAAGRFFPSKEEMRLMHPNWESGPAVFHYLQRILELGKYGPILFRTVLMRKEVLALPDDKGSKALRNWLADGPGP